MARQLELYQKEQGIRQPGRTVSGNSEAVPTHTRLHLLMSIRPECGAIYVKISLTLENSAHSLAKHWLNNQLCGPRGNSWESRFKNKIAYYIPAYGFSNPCKAE